MTLPRLRVSALPPELRSLVQSAITARERAYAPYSRFQVGAAALGPSGVTYLGCNVENKAYGSTMCAERVAVFNAVAAGDGNLSAIALVADLDEPLSPCGECRQVIAELAPTAKIVMANLAGEASVTSIEQLLPSAFSLSGAPAKT